MTDSVAFDRGRRIGERLGITIGVVLVATVSVIALSPLVHTAIAAARWAVR